MPINLGPASDTIREIRKRAEVQRQESRELLDGLLRRDRKPPGDYGDSSYLMIRSTGQDNGSRPLPDGTVFWLSPDIRIRPMSGPGTYTTTLEAGRAYNVEILLRNRGDLPVPSAKVELYLTDPALGFDTRFARRLGIGSTWVPGVSSGVVNIPFIVPGSEAGHKCMFARVFSFSPLDVPLDDTSLSPPVDRHVAQLNLNIIGSAPMPLIVNFVHQPNFQGTLAFRPALLQELIATGHPVLAEKQFVETEGLTARLTRGARFERIDGGPHEISLDNDGRTIRVKSSGYGPSLDEQKRVSGELGAALKAIASGEARPSKFRALFKAHRELAAHAVIDRFSVKLPSMEVGREETVAAHLEARSALGGLVGGITLMFVS
jgi:hypothetical protein